MFKEIFLFELKFRLKKKFMAYIFFAVFFLMSFLAVATDTVTIGGAIGSVNINAPFVIMQIMVVMSFVGIYTIVPLVAATVIRDFETGTYPTFFTTRASKFSYLMGRFWGGYVVAVLTYLGVAAGIMLGSVMPWVDAEQIGPFMLWPYVFSFLAFVIPNTFIAGAMFFAFGTLSRSVLYTWVAVVVYFVAWALAGNLLAELEFREIAALVDFSGANTFRVETQYWTVFERNTLTLPFEGTFLLNRLIWISFGALCLGLTLWRFQFAEPKKRIKDKKKIKDASELRPPAPVPALATAPDFSRFAFLKQFISQTKTEFFGVIKSVPFIIILLFGLFNLFGNVVSSGRIFGTEVLMVTRVMIQNLQGGYFIFLIIIMTVFGGEVIWRGRQSKVNEYYDALPIPGWIPFTSKLAAMFGVVLFMQLAGVILGVLMQFYNGYFDIEYGLYFKSMFLYSASGFALLAFLIMFIHVLVNNKYLGHMIVVLFYIVSFMALPALNLNHNLYLFGQTPSAPYSDMNQYGHFVSPVFWFSVYWGFCAILFAVASNLLWVRGTDSGFKSRLKTSGYRFNFQSKLALTVALVAFMLTGGFIFYNTNVVNDYTTSDDTEARQVEYEQKYKKYEGLPQPRIVDVYAEVDFSPASRDVDIRGRYNLLNKTNAVIDSVHIRQVESSNLLLKMNDLTVGESERVFADSALGYYIYKLQTPLRPGDSLKLTFDYNYRTEGFMNNGDNRNVVHNGSFVNNAVMFPHIGYSRSLELTNKNDRRKRELPPRPQMPAIDDSLAKTNTYLGEDADWVTFETVVSTSPDQIAISPGYLQREWRENGRRYFHYKMDKPILNFYSFLSARYEVYHEEWNGIDIEIYYHNPHDYNIDKMVKSIKRSIEYYSKNFSPYQHRQLRIIEFPAYAGFAQSFPNTVPYSEGIGFIANLEDSTDIDYVFYVTAHEVAHQWWAHQVIGANVQGSTVMSETMSQYSALMVMEQEYGKDKMKKFLKYELDRYLRGRSLDRYKEQPLIYNENQGYIHYRKGSVIMYALRDYIGEEKVNAALAKYIKNVANQDAPFTTSLEFLDHIREAVPDSLQYIIEDWFETITLYDNRATETKYTSNDDGAFKVTLTFESHKMRADSLGLETEIPLADWIDIGVLGKDGKELYLRKHKISATAGTIEITVAEEPTEAGIDPYNKLIDRNPGDNLKKVEKEE